MNITVLREADKKNCISWSW